MKKLIITLLVSWIAQNLVAQTFETIIKHNQNESPSFNSVSLPNNHYLLSSAFVNTQGKTHIYKLNSNGFPIDSLLVPYDVRNFLYKDSVVYFAGSLTGNIGDTLVLGEMDPTSFNVFKLKKIAIQRNSQINLFDFKFLSNCKCFSMSGSITDSSNSSNGFIAQTDSLFKYPVLKYFSAWFSPSSSDPAFLGTMDNPSGNGIWVFTSSPLKKLNSWDNNTASVIPMDSSWNRPVSQNYMLNTPVPYSSTVVPSPGNYVGLTSQAFDGVKLTDSTTLFAGMVMLEQLNNGINVGFEQDMGYVIMDNNLNYIKHEFYGYSDADLSAFNTIDRNDDYAYILHSTVIPIENLLGLTKMDEAGNRLWTKYYSPKGRIQAYGLKTTIDGGVLITAGIFDAYTGTQFQKDVYVLKVDSNGNGPGLITSLSKLKIVPKNNYLIYPNPVKNELHLLKVNTFGNYTFTLYDAYGREVKSTEWTEDEQILSTAGLAAGIYIYRIKDKDGRMASGKIVKQ